MIDFLKLNEKPLYQQKPLLLLLIPVAISACIFYKSDYGSFDPFSSAAQINFIKISKLPLLILAIVPIMLSFIVNAHRTVQVSKQISITMDKNRVDAFTSHYKFFSEIISEVSMYSNELEYTIYFDSNKRVYDLFFPRNSMSSGVMDVNPRPFLDDLDRVLVDLYEVHLNSYGMDKLLFINKENKSNHGSEEIGTQVLFEEFIQNLSASDISDYSIDNREHIYLNVLFAFADQFEMLGISFKDKDSEIISLEDVYEFSKSKILKSIELFYMMIVSVNSRVGADVDSMSRKLDILRFIRVLSEVESISSEVGDHKVITDQDDS